MYIIVYKTMIVHNVIFVSAFVPQL